LEPKLKNHVELVELLGIADLKKGIKLLSFRFKATNFAPGLESIVV
jgi:hypothetical protein